MKILSAGFSRSCFLEQINEPKTGTLVYAIDEHRKMWIYQRDEHGVISSPLFWMEIDTQITPEFKVCASNGTPILRLEDLSEPRYDCDTITLPRIAFGES